MFEKIINFFKGSKPEPKVDFLIKDLGLNYVLEYNMSNWLVQKEYSYDWGDGYFSKEWLISDGKETLLLFFDDSEEVEISVSKKVNTLQELDIIRQDILSSGVPRNNFAFEGKKWILTDENPCLYSETGLNNLVEMVVWVFEEPSGKEFISFSQFGTKSIDGYRGHYIKEYEVSNILPGNKS